MSAAVLPEVKAYEDMTPQELRAELERLDDVCIREAIQVKNLEEASRGLIKVFSSILLAHMRQDTGKVSALLDAAVQKHVMVVPGEQELH